MLVASKDGPINVPLQFKNKSIKGNEDYSSLPYKILVVEIWLGKNNTNTRISVNRTTDKL